MRCLHCKDRIKRDHRLWHGDAYHPGCLRAARRRLNHGVGVLPRGARPAESSPPPEVDTTREERIARYEAMVASGRRIFEPGQIPEKGVR